MAIEYLKRLAKFRDVVGVDEAEALLGWLQARPSAIVDLAECAHLHPANLQVLLASKVRIRAMPTDPELAAWLQTILVSD
ncbi:MAG: hypothetical protein WCQ50_11770 [Spirochaetota bacterium]